MLQIREESISELPCSLLVFLFYHLRSLLYRRYHETLSPLLLMI